MALNRKVEDAFKSERLVYQAFEDTKEDKAFVHSFMNDPVNQSFSHPKLRKPTGLKDVDAFIEVLQKGLLGVKICLSSEESRAIRAEQQKKKQQEATGGDQKKDEEEQKKEDESLIPIGHVSLWPHFQGAEWMSHHRNATLGISLAADFRGKGYGGEAINWALDLAFMSAGLHRVHLECFSFNPNAIKLYRKVGFVEEGRQREIVYYERAWHDILCFSMLEQEWEKLRGLK